MNFCNHIDFKRTVLNSILNTGEEVQERWVELACNPHAGEAETEDCEFRVILNYIATTCLTKEKKRIIIALEGWKYR